MTAVSWAERGASYKIKSPAFLCLTFGEALSPEPQFSSG